MRVKKETLDRFVEAAKAGSLKVGGRWTVGTALRATGAEIRFHGGFIKKLPRNWKVGDPLPTMEQVEGGAVSPERGIVLVAFRDRLIWGPEDEKAGVCELLLVQESWVPGETGSRLNFELTTKVLEGRCWYRPELYAPACYEHDCPGCSCGDR